MNTRSVLRKKIKSPPQRPVNPYLSGKNHRRRDSYLTIKQGRSQSSPNVPNANRNRMSMPRSQTVDKFSIRNSSTFGPPKSARGRPSDINGFQSARCSIQTQATYTNPVLTFEKSRSHCFQPTLSPGLSSIRMCMTRDGKTMSIGGNLSPLSLVKVYPKFENFRTYKDKGKITSLNFSFCMKYLVRMSKYKD